MLSTTGVTTNDPFCLRACSEVIGFTFLRYQFWVSKIDELVFLKGHVIMWREVNLQKKDENGWHSFLHAWIHVQTERSSFRAGLLFVPLERKLSSLGYHERNLKESKCNNLLLSFMHNVHCTDFHLVPVMAWLRPKIWIQSWGQY